MPAPIMSHPLTMLECGFAFFQKRSHALFLVLGGKRGVK